MTTCIYFRIQAVLAVVGTIGFAIVEWRHYKVPSLVNDGKSRQEKPVITSDSFSH